MSLTTASPVLSSSTEALLKRAFRSSLQERETVITLSNGTTSHGGENSGPGNVITTQPRAQNHSALYPRRRRSLHSVQETSTTADDVSYHTNGVSDQLSEEEPYANSVQLQAPAGGRDETDMSMRSDGIDFELEGMTFKDVGIAYKEVELLSQVVAGKWRLSEKDSVNSQMMVLSSSKAKGVSVLSKADSGEVPNGIFLKSDTIRIADAMAMSGAALSLNNGTYSDTFAMMAFSGLQLLFGVAIGSSVMNTKRPESVPATVKVCADEQFVTCSKSMSDIMSSQFVPGCMSMC